jgi:mannose/fructose-specific phosphotransferase system component IIA
MSGLVVGTEGRAASGIASSATMLTGCTVQTRALHR